MNQAPVASPSHRVAVFVLFLVGGLLIFLLGNNWSALFPTQRSALFKWGLVILFLLVAVPLRQSQRLQTYGAIALALCTAAVANAVNWHLGNWLGHLLPQATNMAQKIAVDKLSQAIPVVLSILLLNWLAGNNLGAIFLQKGNLRWGLRFGLISFAVFAAIFAAIAVLQSRAPSGTGLLATGVPLATVGRAIPWILLFILANSLMEELWFRGIMLRPLTSVLGAAASILVTALVFGLAHLGATYVSPIERVIFPIIVCALGLVNGLVMVKTDSIWGSMLFHAGYDLLVIIPVLVSVK